MTGSTVDFHLGRPSHFFEQLWGVGFGDDFRFEINSGVESKVLVRRTSVTVTAAMHATAVWIETESKVHIRAVVLADD